LLNPKTRGHGLSLYFTRVFILKSSSYTYVGDLEVRGESRAHRGRILSFIRGGTDSSRELSPQGGELEVGHCDQAWKDDEERGSVRRREGAEAGNSAWDQRKRGREAKL